MEEKEGMVEVLPSTETCPRDLLGCFSVAKAVDGPPEIAGVDSGEVELSLGLSLGGCLTVLDPKANRIPRSSSIPAAHELSPALGRACSLPAEAEKEQRKRRELQSLKRLEAKRKRIEKNNSMSSAGTDQKVERLCGEDSNRGFLGFLSRSRGSSCEPPPYFGPIPQGSVGSQDSSSSGVSDLNCRLSSQEGFDIQRSSSCTELTITSANRKTVTAPSTSAVGNTVLAPSKRGGSSLPYRAHGSREMKNMMEEMPCASMRREGPNGRKIREMKNMMEEMPCVSTRGEGPNGRKIEGFLYKYKKEEVRIVCVCHGSFLTPAEFVKHAGGGDVDHPLRHIVVNPTPLSLL